MKIQLLGNFLRLLLSGALFLVGVSANAQDLAEIRESGVLRHLGVPYARFVTGDGDGLDVEIIQLFARHIGVRYEFVLSDWNQFFPDLLGQSASGPRPVRGDLIANGLTVLPGRKKLIDFSVSTFPSAVWLTARAASKVKPIKPSGDLATDIRETKARMKEGSTLVSENSCIDPRNYDLQDKGYHLVYFDSRANLILNDVIPAMLKGESEMALLDVPDLIVGMEKWPGQIKVIGPISEAQEMGVGFRKSSPALRDAFNEFFVGLRKGWGRRAARLRGAACASHYTSRAAGVQQVPGRRAHGLPNGHCPVHFLSCKPCNYLERW